MEFEHNSTSARSEFTLVHAGAHCCRAPGALKAAERAKTFSRCAAFCLALGRNGCSFFSFSKSLKICDACTRCALTSGNKVAVSFRSYARRPWAGSPLPVEKRCELPQRAAQCKCTDLNLPALPSMLRLTNCEPSAACDHHGRQPPAASHDAPPSSAPPSSAPTGSASAGSPSASIVFVYGFVRDRVRPWYRAQPLRSYLNAQRLIFRLVLSLRRVRAPRSCRCTIAMATPRCRCTIAIALPHRAMHRAHARHAMLRRQ